MKHTRKFALVATASLGLSTFAAVTPAVGAADGETAYEVTVTIENVAPTDATIQTPFWVAVHDGSFDVYDRDVAASAELERLAEDGNTDPLTEAFAASGAGVDATVAGPNGPIFPGETATHTFVVDPGDARYFSYASMVIPSNDAFVSNGDPLAHPLFDGDGNFVASDFTISGSQVLDAGTEVNDEVPENTAALAQAAPDTGVDEGGVVVAHEGFASGGNVLNAIPAGDFTQDGYQNVAISFEARPVETADVDAVAYAAANQEVPRVSSDAWAWSVFHVRENGTRIDFSSTIFGLDDVTAAHLHFGPRGENGPVVVNLNATSSTRLEGTITSDSLTGPLTGQSVAALVQAIEDGDIYLNVHTETVPSGEIRGQLIL